MVGKVILSFSPEGATTLSAFIVSLNFFLLEKEKEERNFLFLYTNAFLLLQNFDHFSWLLIPIVNKRSFDSPKRISSFSRSKGYTNQKYNPNVVLRYVYCRYGKIVCICSGNVSNDPIFALIKFLGTFRSTFSLFYVATF